jgi:hypothetical protein
LSVAIPFASTANSSVTGPPVFASVSVEKVSARSWASLSAKSRAGLKRTATTTVETRGVEASFIMDPISALRAAGPVPEVLSGFLSKHEGHVA